MERIDRSIRSELGRFAPADGDPQWGSMVAVVRAWPAAVGDTVARNAWPARLTRDGTLLVHTSSSTWSFELGRMTDHILERLRAEAGEGAPPALRFVPGPIPDPPAEADELRRPAGPAVADEDVAEAAALAAAIEDEELRGLVARAAAASLAGARREARSDRGF
jgi:hypothetical protein